MKRLKARVGAAFDRRYVRRDAHREAVDELTARLEAVESELASLRGDGGGLARPTVIEPDLRELATGSAQAIESLLQTELRLWRQIEASESRLEDLEDRLAGVAGGNDASEPPRPPSG